MPLSRHFFVYVKNNNAGVAKLLFPGAFEPGIAKDIKTIIPVAGLFVFTGFCVNSNGAPCRIISSN